MMDGSTLVQLLAFLAVGAAIGAIVGKLDSEGTFATGFTAVISFLGVGFAVSVWTSTVKACQYRDVAALDPCSKAIPGDCATRPESACQLEALWAVLPVVAGVVAALALYNIVRDATHPATTS